MKTLANAVGTAALAVAALLSGACGGPPAPRWIDLAASLDQARQRIAESEHVLPDGRALHLAQEGGAVHLEIPLRAEDWHSEGPVGFWVAETGLALTGGGIVDASGFTLVSETGPHPPAPAWASNEVGTKGFPRGAFQVTWRGVVLRLAKDEKPPARATLGMALQAGEGTRGRVLGRRFSGRGFQIWSGERLSLPVEIPENAELRFATTCEPLLGAPGDAPLAPTVFRVLQDGQPVFEHAVGASSEASHAWHRVPLARTGAHGELAFEVSGTLAFTCFLAPILAPAEVGTRGNRPWGEARPDVILFVADTFRADNMRAYGGTLELTPNLDRFAGRGLLFRRAWAAGTYTLPSHVSMFTGLMPYQAGLRTLTNALPEDLETLAEVLAAAGYRTGAVTDSGIVSRRFAFDQGFEYFDERQIEIDSTVERALAFLDADDGRPAFLFVQSYRAHTPYRVSADTRVRLGETLGIRGEYADLESALARLADARGMPAEHGHYPPELLRSPEAGAILTQLRAHYLGGVVDLDRGFGRFVEQLDARGWFEHGRMFLTSDHGEAFGEHGELEHGEKVFEAKTRIPLVVVGRGIEARVVESAASQVDLLPSIAAVAGVPPRPGWLGHSLFDLRHERPVLSFGSDGDASVSVVEGPRKVIGFQEDGRVLRERLLGAFDLARDPHEENDLQEDASWPLELLRRHAEAIEHALVPVVESRAADLDAAALEELGKLGYVDH